MKWFVLVAFILLLPSLTAWLRTQPRHAPLVWAALTFLPFVIGPWHLFIAPYATPGWSGYVRGWEITLLDVIAISCIASAPGRWPRLGMAWPFLVYFFAVLFAVSQARFINLALSYPIQLARAGIVLIAVARVARHERGERAIFTGLVLGITIQALYALAAKAGGALQTGGSLGHQNLLGFVSHMALMPSFALLLGGRWPKTAALGTISSVIVVVLTASRATILMAGVGLLFTLIFSLLVRFTGRKAAVGFAGIVLLGLSSPIAYSVLEKRLAEQGISFTTEDNERIAFERAAKSMMAAKPLGVGPNHYVFIANTEGYSERAGVNWAFGNRSANVHNAYLLIGAESGYLGLITFVILLASTIILAGQTAIQFRKFPDVDILVGLTASMIAISAHNLKEWIFVMSPSQYVFAASFGMIIGIRSRLLAERRSQKPMFPLVSSHNLKPAVV